MERLAPAASPCSLLDLGDCIGPQGTANMPALVLAQVHTSQGNVAGLVVALRGAEAM